MEKEFIPYEQALALRDLGFNELCSHEYNLCDDEIILQYYEDGITNIDLEILTDDINDENMENEDINLINPSFTAPLYQQAFRWFDKNTHFRGFITKSIEGNNFGWEVVDPQVKRKIVGEEYYYSRQEAELECLKQLIDIQTNEG
jgi:hypothetical protein